MLSIVLLAGVDVGQQYLDLRFLGSFTQRCVKRYGSMPPFRPDFEVPGYDPAENIGRKPSSRL
jgi:hypothetical protein